MLHLVLYGLLAVIIAAGLFLAATRFLPAGEQIAPPLRDEAPWGLPGDRMLVSDDVDSIRLPVALRGYRFAETDILLDRLAGELRVRDMEIARLRGGSEPVVAAGGTDDAPQPPPSDDDERPVTDPEDDPVVERPLDPVVERPSLQKDHDASDDDFRP